MRKLFVHTILLILLIIIPTIPGYLRLYNQYSNPPLILCVDNGGYRKLSVLKGDLDYLEAIFERALENTSKKEGVPLNELMQKITNLFIYTVQVSIDIFKDPDIINRSFYHRNNDIASVYISPPSPPPENIV